MATHIFHPDVAEHGLHDGCARCAELARQPLELDGPNFMLAWERMLRIHWPQRFPGQPRAGAYCRSETEATLIGLLYTWAVFLERYTPLDPHELLDELRGAAAVSA